MLKLLAKQEVHIYITEKRAVKDHYHHRFSSLSESMISTNKYSVVLSAWQRAAAAPGPSRGRPVSPCGCTRSSMWRPRAQLAQPHVTRGNNLLWRTCSSLSTCHLVRSRVRFIVQAKLIHLMQTYKSKRAWKCCLLKTPPNWCAGRGSGGGASLSNQGAVVDVN